MSNRRSSLALLCAAMQLGCPGQDIVAPTCQPTSGTVVAVSDGDTITVEDERGKTTEIRYLLIDSPETSSSRDSICFNGDARPSAGEPECFAVEARELNTLLVMGQEVDLEYDSEGCVDGYGRSLAYVWLGQRMVNRIMVERGYACTFIFRPQDRSQPYQYQDEFVRLEGEAEVSGAGLWGACN